MVDVNGPLIAAMLRESLQQGQTAQLTVTSNSMAPLLRRGDQILLEAVTIEHLNQGDIITLATDSQIFTHRYWETVEAGGLVRLRTRGDRPMVFDNPWLPEALIGRVIGRLRHDHRLRLNEGAGNWLNQHLCQLAGMEYRWWGQGNNGKHSPFRSRFVRGARGAVYGWEMLMVGLVSRIN